MIEIDGKIVSEQILTERFLCDLSACCGICCVEGNSGAPLDEQEAGILETEYSSYRPFLTPEGIKAIERQGFMVIDEDGDQTTPLVAEAECAYCCRDAGITFCAIEKAWKAGATQFRKPVSCHLYPIRLAQFGDGTIGLNYHRWDICKPAVELGRREGVPLYIALREPLIRRFGQDFFEALCVAEKFLNEERTE